MQQRTSLSFLLSFFLILAGLGWYVGPFSAIPLSTHGEAREALVVRDMDIQANTILPLRNGIDIPSKPPLFHWLARGIARVSTLSDEASLRFPSALCAGLLLGATFFVVTFFLGLRAGFLAFLILATSFEFLRSASLARVDMVFSCFVAVGTCACVALVQRYRRDSSYTLGFAMVTIFCCVAATLAKGPAGLAFPLVVGGLSCFLRNDRRLPEASLVLWGIIIAVVSAAIAGIWYWHAYRIGGERFLDVHLMRENLARVVGSDEYDPGHNSPKILSPLLCLVGFLPWSAFFPWVVAMLWSERGALRDVSGTSARCALLWVAFYMVFFGLTQSRRTVYYLPCFPALTYLMLFALDRSIVASAGEVWRKLGAGIIAALSIFGGLAIGALDFTNVLRERGRLVHFPFLREQDEIYVDAIRAVMSMRPETTILIVSALFLIALASSQIWRDRVMIGLERLALGLIVVMTVANYYFVPAIAELTSPKNFVNTEKSLMNSAEVLVQFPKTRELYHVAYYLGRDIPVVSSNADIDLSKKNFLLSVDSDEERVHAAFPNLKTLATSTELAAYGAGHLVLSEILENPKANEHAPHKK